MMLDWDHVVPLDPPEREEFCECGHSYEDHNDNDGVYTKCYHVTRYKAYRFLCECDNFDMRRPRRPYLR